MSESLVGVSTVSLADTSGESGVFEVVFFIPEFHAKLIKCKSHAVGGDFVGHCTRVGGSVKLLVEILLRLIRRFNMCVVK